MARGGFLSTRKGLGSTPPRGGKPPGFLTTTKGTKAVAPRSGATVKITSGR